MSFDRVEKAVEMGYDEASLTKGLGLAKSLGESPFSDIQATVNAFSGIGKIALVGFDWGGFLAYHAANRVQNVATVVSYYGCGIINQASLRRKVPTLLHFGTLDQYIPMDQLSSFRMTRPDLRIYNYAAGHHFASEDSGGYDASAAQKAWELTLEHVSHILEGSPAVTLKNQGSYASAGGKEKKKKPATADDGLGPPI